MATGKKSFILYCDQRGTWERLSDEQAGKLIKHVFSYVNDENPEADFITELAFEGIKRALKSDLKKWEAKQEQRSEAGKRSAEIRRLNATEANDRSTSVNERSISSTVNGSVNGSVSVNESTNVDINSHSDFDLFFMAYNKKVDLIPCQREWSNIDKAEHQKILKHVPKYVSAIHDKKYLKSPLKYLKDRTWLDEDLPNAKPKTERFIPTPPKIY